MTDRAFIATEILDDYFGYKDYHEALGERVNEAAETAVIRASEYGYEKDELPDYVTRTVCNVIWNMYSGGDTCWAIARRIVEAWNHAGLKVY